MELRITIGDLSSFAHARHAVMLSIAAATRRQTRLTLRGHRKEWRNERQAEYGEQQNGKKSTQ
jgi:hypothetical protein